MPATLQTRQITEGFRNFPQKTKCNVSSITGSRTSKGLLCTLFLICIYMSLVEHDNIGTRRRDQFAKDGVISHHRPKLRSRLLHRICLVTINSRFFPWNDPISCTTAYEFELSHNLPPFSGPSLVRKSVVVICPEFPGGTQRSRWGGM